MRCKSGSAHLGLLRGLGGDGDSARGLAGQLRRHVLQNGGVRRAARLQPVQQQLQVAIRLRATRLSR